MNAKNIQLVLERLGCEKIKVKNNGWVEAACPLAPYVAAHGGTDKRPSFGVREDEENHSGVRCFTCGFIGTLLTLLWRLSVYTKRDFTKIRAFITEHDEISMEALKKRIDNIPDDLEDIRDVAGIPVSPRLVPKNGAGEQLELGCLDESLLGSFKDITDEAWQFFEKRGLSVATVKEWELGWHPKARRISIPVRDKQGRLVCISGRALDKEVQPKFLHSKGFRRDFYLYGENRCQTLDIVYLVEGFFDVIGLWQKGYRNALCFMGSGLSRFQVEKLTTLGNQVIIVPDGDKAGSEIADRCLASLQPFIWKSRIVEVPEGKDPDELSSEYLLDILGSPQAAVAP